jgi:hypothetical protein
MHRNMMKKGYIVGCRTFVEVLVLITTGAKFPGRRFQLAA